MRGRREGREGERKGGDAGGRKRIGRGNEREREKDRGMG